MPGGEQEIDRRESLLPVNDFKFTGRFSLHDAEASQTIASVGVRVLDVCHEALNLYLGAPGIFSLVKGNGIAAGAEKPVGIVVVRADTEFFRIVHGDPYWCRRFYDCQNFQICFLIV